MRRRFVTAPPEPSEGERWLRDLPTDPARFVEPTQLSEGMTVRPRTVRHSEPSTAAPPMGVRTAVAADVPSFDELLRAMAHAVRRGDRSPLDHVESRLPR
jgi:hypothetical protein